MNNFKHYLFLSLIGLTFAMLLLIFDPMNLYFKWIGFGTFIGISILSFIMSGKLYRELDNYPFVIRKGKHKIIHRRPIKTNGTLSASFTFDEQHRYYDDSNPKEMNLHINKLIGLSSLNIHEDSVRIGWRHTKKDRFSIFAYWYRDGKRHSEYLMHIKEGTKMDVQIISMDNFTVININDKASLNIAMKRECNWVTFPYFGGSHPAPHRMQFDIKLNYDK